MRAGKVCSMCKVYKIAENFNRRTDRPSGLRSECLECAAKNRQIPKNKARNKANYSAWIAVPENAAHRKEMRETPEGRESARRRGIKWLSKPENKKHRRDYQANWYSIPENKAWVKQYDKERHGNPRIRARQSETGRLWRIKNIHRTRAYSREWSRRPEVVAARRDRRNLDIEFRLRINLRARFGIALRAALTKKYVSSVKNLGCTMSQLITHLESMFQPGMSWDNYGKGEFDWSIDHIRPLSSFKLSDMEQQKLAVHYTNLRPMWHIENIRKGDKWDPASQSAIAAK